MTHQLRFSFFWIQEQIHAITALSVADDENTRTTLTEAATNGVRLFRRDITGENLHLSCSHTFLSAFVPKRLKSQRKTSQLERVVYSEDLFLIPLIYDQNAILVASKNFSKMALFEGFSKRHMLEFEFLYKHYNIINSNNFIF